MELTRGHAIFVIGILLVAIGSAAMITIPDDDSTNHTGVNVQSNGTLLLEYPGGNLTELDTVVASSYLLVTWDSDIQTDDIQASLYTASYIEIESPSLYRVNGTHVFNFTLDSAPEGINECFVGFSGSCDSGAIYGESYRFFVEQDGYPEYPDPEFIYEPLELEYTTGYTAEFEWGIIYMGPCVARFAVNGVTKASQTLIQTSKIQNVTFYFSFDTEGLYKVKLILEPEYDIAFASEVTINVTDSASTSHTTSTSTTEKTTSQTSVNPATIGIEILLVVLILLVAISTQCRREE
jgi:hypothetical protein